MTTLIPEARQRLEDYLRQVRNALGGCSSVNADEVERDIREHIDSELTAASEPVTLGELNEVLARLGRPDQWVPPEQPSWLGSFVARWRNGPEDWRLAYLSFGLLVLGVAIPHYLWFLIPVSYVFSRAALSVACGRGEDLGAQKWFIYPSLVVMDLIILAVTLLTPPFLAGVAMSWYEIAYYKTGAHHDAIDFSRLSRSQLEIVAAAAAFVAICWWILLGIILLIWPQVVRAAFRPFADWFDRPYFLRMLYRRFANWFARKFARS